MDRKDFLRLCGLGCLGAMSLSLLESCSGTRYYNARIQGRDMFVPVESFSKHKNDKKSYYRYIVAQNESLEYPICVYRFSETEYVALLMKCTHQGTELQVFGDRFLCPAHGSEFNSHGEVKQGPASKPLRTFRLKIEDKTIKISLV